MPPFLPKSVTGREAYGAHTAGYTPREAREAYIPEVHLPREAREAYTTVIHQRGT